MISPARANIRQTAKPSKDRPPPLKTKMFPAPRRGLQLAENIANQQQEGALVLDNYVCTSKGIRPRGGTPKRYTLDSAVKSMWEFNTSGGVKKFAATETKIYDLTGVADPDAVPTALVSGQTGGYYCTAHMATVAGEYLIAVNGADDAILFDTSGYATSTIAGVATDKLSHVWTYANRWFFVERGTMDAWYLAVDSITGTALKFSLAGVFQRGGSLVYGARWSMDAGDGLSAKCVFVSSAGEVAVFDGTDPASASAWSLSGLYYVGQPIGLRAHVQAGGDLLMGVDAGIVPITQAIAKDRAVLALAAVTAPIEPLWREEVSKRQAEKLEILNWAAQGLIIVSLPGQGALVANAQTGAWSTFTGLDVQCMARWGTRAYFGTSDGHVREFESGGSDLGLPYVCQWSGVFDHFGSVGVTKTVTMARPSLLSAVNVAPKVSFAADYVTEFPAAPPSAADQTILGEWDVAEWDVGVWDTTGVSAYRASWAGVGKTGAAFAPQLQMTFGVTPLPRIEVVAIEAAYIDGQPLN